MILETYILIFAFVFETINKTLASFDDKRRLACADNQTKRKTAAYLILISFWRNVRRQFRLIASHDGTCHQNVYEF